MLPIELRSALPLETQPTIFDWVIEVQTRWQDAPELSIDQERLGHLAIICDGNRRAAIKRGIQPPFLAHLPGVETVLGIDRIARRKWQIPTCTYWLWSTENWQRGPYQVDLITKLARAYLTREDLMRELEEDGVRIIHLGSKPGLATDLQEALTRLEEKTKAAKRHIVNLAINYGGREELAQAIVKIISDINAGKLTSRAVLENPMIITDYLYTAGQRLPDFIIRTGMTRAELPRTNWFMPLQTGQSRFKFLPDMFPELTPGVLAGAIRHFLHYRPRLGK